MPQADNTPLVPSPAAVARIEETVDRFEEAWQAGGRPAIDDHLAADGEVRAALLVELVHVDLEYRLKAGEAVRVESYLERYPELRRDRGAVLDLLAAEWKLRRRCDPSIEVEEYVRRFPDYRDDLLASATVSLLPAGALASPPDSEPGAAASTRSRYRILRLHARGGLGEILTARDEDLHREVALKRLQPRLAGAAESRGRFLREAEITSQLEHPGVVPVYGLGQAADGSPVYAMRFIRGDTFQEAVDRFHAAHGRPLRERSQATRGARRTARVASPNSGWPSAACWPDSSASATPSPTPTAGASCTATSSPATSSWASTARRWWWIGAWPSRSAGRKPHRPPPTRRRPRPPATGPRPAR